MNPPQIRTPSTMWYIPKKNLFGKQDDILYAAEKYIEENGTEAFERIIRKVPIALLSNFFYIRRAYNILIFDFNYQLKLLIDELIS